MDVLTSSQLGAIVERPDIEGGKPEVVVVPETAEQKNYRTGPIAARVATSKAWKPSFQERSNPDPMIAIISEGRKASIDPRFFNDTVKADTPSKLNKMADEIISEHERTKDFAFLGAEGEPEERKGGTQIVFYNLGFGEQIRRGKFDARDALTKRLLAGGIKREEIAWFDDADTDAQKERVFKDVRAGSIRVLIGSAKRMGTGVNVQRRLTAMHYLDPPWFPADYEQPQGRIVRMGNLNEMVKVKLYATKGSYDEQMWKLVAGKQRAMDQAFSGDETVRHIDDISEASHYEMASALASGDPRVLRLAGLNQDIDRLDRLSQAHHESQRSIQYELEKIDRYQLPPERERLEKLKQAQEYASEDYASYESGSVGEQSFGEGEKASFGDAIKQAFNEHLTAHATTLKPNSKTGWKVAGPIGKFNNKYELRLNVLNQGDSVQGAEIEMGIPPLWFMLGTASDFKPEASSAGLVQKMVNIINHLDTTIRRSESDIKEYELEAKRLRKAFGAPFEHEAERSEKIVERTNLEDELLAEGALAAQQGQHAGPHQGPPPDVVDLGLGRGGEGEPAPEEATSAAGEEPKIPQGATKEEALAIVDRQIEKMKATPGASALGTRLANLTERVTRLRDKIENDDDPKRKGLEPERRNLEALEAQMKGIREDTGKVDIPFRGGKGKFSIYNNLHDLQTFRKNIEDTPDIQFATREAGKPETTPITWTADRVRQSFPAQRVKQVEDGKFEVSLKNGGKILVDAQAREIQNSELAEKMKLPVVKGSWRRVSEDGFIRLTEHSEDTTLDHEAYHAAESMADLSDAEITAAAKKYGDAEGRADAYEKWLAEGKAPKDTFFGRIWQTANRLRDMLFGPRAETAFEKVATGKAWEGKARAEEGQAAPQFSLKEKAEEAKEGLKTAAAGARATLKERSDDIKQIITPTKVSERSERAAGIIREENARYQRNVQVASKELDESKKYLGTKDTATRNQFMSDAERGVVQTDPKLAVAHTGLRKILGDAARQVRDLGTGKLQSLIDDYFPHIWKDPARARKLFADLYAKRPLEGGKAFLHQRILTYIDDGLKMGLELAYDNPIDAVISKAGEMYKYVAAVRMMQRLDGEGLRQFVLVGKRGPAGWVKGEGAINTRYGSPDIPIKEAFDKKLMSGLESVARGLGITQERLAKMRGQKWGEAWPGGIRTRFAGPESVVAHEIGHVLDFKYGLWDKITQDVEGLGKRGTVTKTATEAERAKIQKELRALADLRWAGEDTSGYYKKYVRKKEEKMAVVLESYIHAPDELKRVAPTILKNFESFLKERSETKPLLDMKPSLVLGTGDSTVKAGGMVIRGFHHMPEEVARLFKNYLSPGLRDKSKNFRSWLGVSALLNNFQLGFSAFHIGFTSIDAATSEFARGLIQLSRGNVGEALRAMTTGTVAAPYRTYQIGKMLEEEYFHPGTVGGNAAQIVEAMIKGGGRTGVERMYRTDLIEAVKKNYADGGFQRLLAAIKVPGAVSQIAATPVMRFALRQKLGVFSKLAEMEINKNPNMTPAEMNTTFGKIWDSVDNRMGQLVYDNLFWHKSLKDLAMMTVRSVGWNLGTIRELAGGGKDIAAQLGKLAKGEKPELTYRASYLIALPLVVGTMGAITQYLFTGKGPDELKDYFYPKNGNIDASGKPERVALPSYMKDIFHYGTAPLQTLSAKLHPGLETVVEMLENKNFYGTKIYNEEDDFVTKAKDLALHVGAAAEPFGVRGFVREAQLGSAAKGAWSFIGIVPAPARVNKTPAENLISDIMKAKMPPTRTQEAADKATMKNNILHAMRTGDIGNANDQLQTAITSGKLSSKEIRDIHKMAGRQPIVLAFEKITPEEALKVWDKANPDEKKVLAPLLVKKRNRLYLDAPERRRQLLPLFQKALAA